MSDSLVPSWGLRPDPNAPPPHTRVSSFALDWQPTQTMIDDAEGWRMAWEHCLARLELPSLPDGTIVIPSR